MTAAEWVDVLSRVRDRLLLAMSAVGRGEPEAAAAEMRGAASELEQAATQMRSDP